MANNNLDSNNDSSKDSDEAAIRKLVDNWHSATAAGDVDAVLALMSPDVVFLVAGQEPMKGRGAFETGLRSILTTHRITSSYEIQEIAVSGGLAYCWSLLSVQIIAKAAGKTMLRTGSALSILRKQADGCWLVVRDANLLALVA